MLTVKMKFELELNGKEADDVMEAWCEAKSPEKLRSYFEEYIDNCDVQGKIKALNAQAEWRPDNDKS